MDFSAIAPWIVIPIQIFFLDLLLGADNAVVIAIACRDLSPEQSRKAIILGTGGAILFRFLLTIGAGLLFNTPLLKLAGATLLIIIAVNLIEEGKPEAAARPGAAPLKSSAHRFWSAAIQIVLADATMSLDNVVAIAGVARGNLWLLAIGVLFSIPVLMFGSLILANLARRFPAIVLAGGALLGWIAGDMAASDPFVSHWTDLHAPILATLAPALCALYVIAQALFLAHWRRRLAEGKWIWMPRIAVALPTFAAFGIIALAATLEAGYPR